MVLQVQISKSYRISTSSFLHAGLPVQEASAQESALAARGSLFWQCCLVNGVACEGLKDEAFLKHPWGSEC